MEELREKLKSSLPDYMIPSYILQLDKLPLNPNGKVDRKALPDPEEAYQAAGRAYEAPRTDTEKQLTLIWEEVLGRKGIGVTDNFFDSGGHSLKVTKVISLIERKLGVTVPLTAIFKAATIRELAEHILDTAKFGIQDADEAMVHLSGRPEDPIFSLFLRAPAMPPVLSRWPKRSSLMVSTDSILFSLRLVSRTTPIS